MIILIVLLFLMICIVCFSSSTFEVAQNALKLWANNVIPSLLPFFICIDLLKATPFVAIVSKLLTPILRPLFGVPGVGAFALSMGWLSGYPTGAKITSELYQDGKITAGCQFCNEQYIFTREDFE